MTLVDIAKLEQDNKDYIYLMKEGNFWHAYEQSAYRFLMHFKSYKVLLRESKALPKPLVHIGFPDVSLEQWITAAEQKRAVVEKEDNFLKIGGIDMLSDDFSNWRELQVAEHQKKSAMLPTVKIVSSSNSPKKVEFSKENTQTTQTTPNTELKVTIFSEESMSNTYLDKNMKDPYYESSFYKEACHFMRVIGESITNFPSHVQPTYGKDLQDSLRSLIRCISLAQESQENRKRYLDRTSRLLYSIKIDLRVCCDLNYVSVRHYAYLLELVERVEQELNKSYTA